MFSKCNFFCGTLIQVTRANPNYKHICIESHKAILLSHRQKNGNIRGTKLNKRKTFDNTRTCIPIVAKCRAGNLIRNLGLFGGTYSRNNKITSSESPLVYKGSRFEIRIPAIHITSLSKKFASCV